MFKLHRSHSYMSDADFVPTIDKVGQCLQQSEMYINIDATLIHTVELVECCKFSALLGRFIIAELAARTKRTPFQETSYVEIPNYQSTLVTGDLTLSLVYHDDFKNNPIFTSHAAFLDKINEIAEEVKPFLLNKKLSEEIEALMRGWSRKAVESFNAEQHLSIDAAVAGVVPSDLNKYFKDTFFKDIESFKNLDAYYKLASIMAVNINQSLLFSLTTLFDPK